MRSQGHGHVVNISSVVGRIAFPGLAAYVAGKHALEGMSQALAVEAAPHNIRVTVVEPGMFATRYGTSMTEAHQRIPAYDVTNREMLEGARGLAENPETGRPEDFAARVLDIVAAQDPTPCGSRSATTRTATWSWPSRPPARSSPRPGSSRRDRPRRRSDGGGVRPWTLPGQGAWCWMPRCPGTRVDRGAAERRWSPRCRRPGNGLRRTVALGAAIRRPTSARTARRMSTVTRFMVLPFVEC
ncbi:SDR family NAD(P)-dependent oxidoreductase [Streptomyces sp. NPDC048331]|uniref:SDR family NAD(P)-dependent oxidoreductase n=1 Tax=Streptomyces sp. NPDC048331 TaxID=3365534 RepID=UPI00371FCC8E